MAFRKGIEPLKEATNTGGDFQKTEYIRWKGGESKVIRFLTDGEDLITVSLHTAKTADGKFRQFVCRKEVEPGARCVLCESDIKKQDRGYGIAVLRVQVKDDDGKLVGVQDAVVEEQSDGKVAKRPIVGIVSQAPSNFWFYFYSRFEKYGTITDRDWEITRWGDDKNTKYTADPLEPVEIKNFEERYKNYMPDLEEHLARLGAAEYYSRHLDGESSSGAGSSDEDSDFAKLSQAAQELKAGSEDEVYS